MEVDSSSEEKVVNWEQIGKLASAHTCANKFYYVRDDEISYKFDLLLKAALIACQQCCDNNPIHNKWYISQKLYSPNGSKYGWVMIYSANDFSSEALLGKIVAEIENNTILDAGRSNGDTTCPLTCDVYSKPVLLNLNGRTYSFDAIQLAIAKSLMKDENLRLEDMTITPSRLNEIVLLPRTDLKESHPDIPKKFSYEYVSIEFQSFDMTKVVAKNIPEMNAVLANLPKNSNGMWDYHMLWNSYAKFRELPLFTCNDELIENLSFENILLPPHHPKCDRGHITFKNILFKNCRIDLNCWCGISVRSSKFKLCIFDCTKLDREMSLSRCILEECTFVVKGRNTKEEKCIAMDDLNLGQIFGKNIDFSSTILQDCILNVI